MVVPVTEFIQELEGEPEDARWGNLREFAHLTALKQAQDGTFYLGNWWRGPLLYALASRYGPRHVLEFGFGRGYGALAMALASVDGGYDSRVWSIDRYPPEETQPWPIDEGDCPRLKNLSVEEVWGRSVPAEVRERVQLLTGDSYEIMRDWTNHGPSEVDFVFIDGGHDYWSVKHDLLSALQVAEPGSVFVFDDYGERRRYGVKDLLENEVRPHVPEERLTVVDTFSEDARPPVENHVEHKMAVLNLSGHPEAQERLFTAEETERFLRRYRILRVGRQVKSAIRSSVKSLTTLFPRG